MATNTLITKCKSVYFGFSGCLHHLRSFYRLSPQSHWLDNLNAKIGISVESGSQFQKINRHYGCHDRSNYSTTGLDARRSTRDRDLRFRQEFPRILRIARRVADFKVQMDCVIARPACTTPPSRPNSLPLIYSLPNFQIYAS